MTREELLEEAFSDGGKLASAYTRLVDAVISVIACDRVAYKDYSNDDIHKLELLPDESVMVADLLRGLGLPIGHYP